MSILQTFGLDAAAQTARQARIQDKNATLDFAEEIEVDKRRGLYAPSDGRVRFRDLARAWLDSKHNLKRSTRARYKAPRGLCSAVSYSAVTVADLR